MSRKNKLNKLQSRRIKQNHNKRLRNEQQLIINWDRENLGPLESGTIISRYGQHADIEDQHGETLRCDIRRTISSLICGDKVRWRRANKIDSNRQGVIEAVQDRNNLLTRPDFYDGVKPIAANLDQILIVSALLPEFSANIIDRYLIAAEDVEILPIILVNKADLINQTTTTQIAKFRQIYQNIGYSFHTVSNQTGEGMDELQQLLADKVSIFVGQSGVGKSSLTNTLLPEANISTQIVSETSGLGQHTTTVARLYNLEKGGHLIDSPGIREFGLWHLSPERVTWCFKEFRQYLGTCKFRDCRHQSDPGCAIRAAVNNGEIDPERYSNYHSIIKSMRDNKSTHSR